MLDVLGSIDSGLWPDWLAAVGTVGTLVIAVLVLARESGDRRRRREFERSEQARPTTLYHVVYGA